MLYKLLKIHYFYRCIHLMSSLSVSVSMHSSYNGYISLFPPDQTSLVYVCKVVRFIKTGNRVWHNYFTYWTSGL